MWNAPAILLSALFVLVGYLPAQEHPTSYGKAATVDAALIRVPPTQKPPTIDGKMSPKEWEDASAFTGFWYDIGGGAFNFLAPKETQNNVYLMFDREKLYGFITYPVYPEGSWLRSRGRFPNVLNHPLYGVLWDDHIEFELRPYHDPARGFQMGLIRFDVNSLNTVCDWTWSRRGQFDMTYLSKSVIRSHVDEKAWGMEFSVPFKSFVVLDYAGKDKNGQPVVVTPPPDGTKYRFWVHPGLGGSGLPLTHVFDQHQWNTTKGQLIFDSQAVAFQCNDLGPIQDDVIDVRFTVKNHATRSQTMRLGFFVESTRGLIYSSYDAPDLNKGILELTPGESRKIRLRKAFPGITKNGNVLWFDVRSAGRPAKLLFRARLMRFHSRHGGEMEYENLQRDHGITVYRVGDDNKPIVDPNTGKPVRQTGGVPYTRILPTMLKKARPERTEFDARMQLSHYDKRVFVVIDVGIDGGSDQSKRAKEAKLIIMKDDPEETVVKEINTPFNDVFAILLAEVPEFVEEEKYKATILLFDQNKRIVGEKDLKPFKYQGGPWKNNKLGLGDEVWEPFEPIKANATNLETVKHRFAITPQGMPGQIVIKPDWREIPLEKRKIGARVLWKEGELLEIGRGPQLRSPMRLEAVIDGKRVNASITKAASITRPGKSETVYTSEMKFGPLPAKLVSRYDCDGSIHFTLDYGSDQPAKIDLLEMVMPVDGLVDIAFSETGKGSMAAADAWECTLPDGEGIVWDSKKAMRELTYGRFVPWFWFGSGDRGFTFYCDSSEGWMFDAEGSTIQIERDAAGKATMRVQFVNHTAEVKGRRTIPFTILTHPAKNKPKNFRSNAWYYTLGHSWAAGYWVEPYDLSEEYLKRHWRQASQAPADLPYEQAHTWRKDDPPFMRYGKWRNAQMGFSVEAPNVDRMWEDKATYLFERQIRVGRRIGWHMDEYWPIGFGWTDNLAMGNGYILPREQQNNKTHLPWTNGYLTRHQRDHYKRLARIHKINNVPNRHQAWTNNEATMLESFWWSSFLVEGAGAEHRAFEVDMVTQFPISVYRYLSQSHSGLATAHMADATHAEYGDDKRLDRQIIGRALLHDIGVTPVGPHGIIYHKEDVNRLLTELTKFGYFDENNIEKLPYWRNQQTIKIGDKPSSESEVYVSAYRRSLPEGNGYHALIVVMNESFDPVELPLHLLDEERLLCGPNTLKGKEVLGQTKVHESLTDWWQKIASDSGNSTVLMDIESGDIVTRISENTYGPIHIPYHDYRIFMAKHVTP